MDFVQVKSPTQETADVKRPSAGAALQLFRKGDQVSFPSLSLLWVHRFQFPPFFLFLNFLNKLELR